MDDQEPQFLEVGAGEKRRRIAYRLSGGGAYRDLTLFWLSGFLSDMGSTKALVMAEFAQERGLPMLRFDYSGHGLSSGSLLEASIGDWVEEAAAVLGVIERRRALVVGSSMGAWIALLLARELARAGKLEKIAGLVLIAPAWDMTERLMAHRMTPEIKATLERDGVHYEPSLYGEPYPITKHLIEEGRNHLLGVETLHLDVPVRILQGMRDPDVPWGHALDLVDLLHCSDVELTLIKGADHRQSRPEDLRRLETTVAALLAELQREGTSEARPSR
ncbi:alpha/beta hydrolase [Methyloceanibacter sp.]|uniref:alpha/beta hydrolase n=1 Tax=Methyloceanibacter sp. TaxID=1965321 RepID=UPI002D31BB4F|nr:alpha/beta hydrolase [Methyloceanibacter sp.]HZP07858.1 alpha/beta hydrolase [Methyloceanibacter sp.]